MGSGLHFRKDVALWGSRAKANTKAKGYLATKANAKAKGYLATEGMEMLGAEPSQGREQR